MFDLGDFGDEWHQCFLKILILACFTCAISKFSKMHLDDLSQITLPNMRLLVINSNQILVLLSVI